MSFGLRPVESHGVHVASARVALATASVVGVNPVEAPEPISPFERKYAHSGHALFEVSVPGSGKQTSRNRAA